MFGEGIGSNTHKTPLSSLGDIVSGVTKGRKINELDILEIPYMRVANVKDGYMDLSEIKTIPATNNEIQLYHLEYGDVLLTEGGDPDKLGRGAIWFGEINLCIHQNHIFRVRLNKDQINYQYFSLYLQEAFTKQYFLKAAKQTTGIASINMTQLKALPVFVPPLPLQNAFAAFVQQVDKSKFSDRKWMEILVSYTTAGQFYRKCIKAIHLTG
ncbi:restriction endonuclease subunit S [Treponema primitia]|uniref:restriction endonuclease subunit S n=1 Tax=Treponema primitia TaxID=88058 RepID=UPI00397FC25A